MVPPPEGHNIIGNAPTGNAPVVNPPARPAGEPRSVSVIEYHLEKEVDELSSLNAEIKGLPKRVKLWETKYKNLEDVMRPLKGTDFAFRDAQLMRDEKVGPEVTKLTKRLADAPKEREESQANVLKLKEELKTARERAEARAKEIEEKRKARLAAAAILPSPPTTEGSETQLAGKKRKAAGDVFGSDAPVRKVLKKTVTKVLVPKESSSLPKLNGGKRKAPEDFIEDDAPVRKISKKRAKEPLPMESPSKAHLYAKNRKAIEDSTDSDTPLSKISKKRVSEPLPKESSSSPQVNDSSSSDEATNSNTPPRTVSEKSATEPQSTETRSPAKVNEKKRKASNDSTDSESPPRKIAKKIAEDPVAPEHTAAPLPPQKLRKNTGVSRIIGRDRFDLNGKGVARKVVARKADGKKSGSVSSRESIDGEDVSGKSRIGSPKARTELKGLTNHNQSCFSSVVIQMIDAAMDEATLDALLGDVDDSVETFGLKDATCKRFDSAVWLETMSKGLKQKQAVLRAAIKAAAKADETAKVSATKHLRSVLANLRDDYHDTVSPYIFQSVLAFGASADIDRTADGLSARQQMSGDTQEDCFEYYQALLNALIEDPHAQDADALKKLFEVETATKDVCQHAGCGYESEVRKSVNNYLSVDVPKVDGNTGSADFGKLLKASRSSARDVPCPTCENATLVARAAFSSLPENLVVKVNRSAMGEDGKPAKIETMVDLKPEGLIRFASGDTYEIVAVVRHEGLSANHGHYTILRKFEGEWYNIDDKNCVERSVEDVRDHAREGKSAMVLLKRGKKE